jgi:hypothetical protein
MSSNMTVINEVLELFNAIVTHHEPVLQSELPEYASKTEQTMAWFQDRLTAGVLFDGSSTQEIVCRLLGRSLLRYEKQR